MENVSTFKRPKKNFKQSIKTQCEILSDTYKKVRLFYSGGTDSNLILHNLLETKSKPDEEDIEEEKRNAKYNYAM
jgi:predicted phosphoadenosine phosphosulfate sulfurtransferase